MRDVWCHPTAGLSFRVRKAKGKDGAPRFRVISIPVDFGNKASVPYRVWFLLRAWRAAKQRLCPSLAGPDALLWALPADPAGQRFDSALQTHWLQVAASSVDAPAPFGVAWTSHALRHGAASAMAAIGAPMFRIRDHGGWAPGSATLETTYIHASCRATRAAFAFFGHLCPVAPSATMFADDGAV
jgi:integrase